VTVVASTACSWQVNSTDTSLLVALTQANNPIHLRACDEFSIISRLYSPCGCPDREPPSVSSRYRLTGKFLSVNQRTDGSSILPGGTALNAPMMLSRLGVLARDCRVQVEPTCLPRWEARRFPRSPYPCVSHQHRFGQSYGHSRRSQDNPDAVFIFNVGTTLTTCALSEIKLINGASPANVY
jgi:hypothetical protein